jgi:hypothetical protein
MRRDPYANAVVASAVTIEVDGVEFQLRAEKTGNGEWAVSVVETDAYGRSPEADYNANLADPFTTYRSANAAIKAGEKIARDYMSGN